MQITPIYNTYYKNQNTITNAPKTSTCFRSKEMAPSAKSQGKSEYSYRVISNKISDLFSSKSNKHLLEQLANLKPKSDRAYMEQLSEISRLYATQKTIDVNIEDGILEKLANKKESVIFIMNHSNQAEDPKMLAVLNTLLTEAYKKSDCEKFPLPKIIMNEDILKTMNSTKRQAFENFGAVGIDANLVGADKNVNARAFLPLVRDFARDNCNIFIFPEGRLAVNEKMSFNKRFQPGVANLINKILCVKNEVTVVPVGFAYGKGKNKNLTSMNIGTPIEIKRVDDKTCVTCGDVMKDKNSVLYNFFDKNKESKDVTITSKGEPVGAGEVSRYLKTILCENLRINSELAVEKLNVESPTSEIVIL